MKESLARRIRRVLNSCYLYLRFFQMPGPDIFTRRRTRLTRHFKRGDRLVLDCGFGNGWFSYLAYKSGARVIAISPNKGEVKKARDMFNEFKGIDEDRLSFLEASAYGLGDLNLYSQVDEIICFETLEHIKQDRAVCESFYKLLKKDGILHLCCPNANHPRWKNETLDLREERSGHVRAGYAINSYKELLEPIGFAIECSENIGGKTLVFIYKVIWWVNNNLGKYFASMIAFLLSFLVRFDKGGVSNPYLIYVRCRKR